MRNHLYARASARCSAAIAADRREIPGFADDYAFHIQGLLDLYEASFDVQWLRWREQLQATQDRSSGMTKRGGYFSGTGQDTSILLRMKEDNDGAEPSPSSVAALESPPARADPRRAGIPRRAEKTIAAFSAPLQHYPRRCRRCWWRSISASRSRSRS